MSRYIRKRYIDAEVLKSYLNPISRKTDSHFLQLIDNIPTADVEEVRHGYWIPVTYGDCKCSICGNAYGLCGGLMGDYNYCPGCGARMDKEKEE